MHEIYVEGTPQNLVYCVGCTKLMLTLNAMNSLEAPTLNTEKLSVTNDDVSQYNYE